MITGPSLFAVVTTRARVARGFTASRFARTGAARTLVENPKLADMVTCAVAFDRACGENFV